MANVTISMLKGAQKTQAGITKAAYGGAFTGDIDININQAVFTAADKGLLVQHLHDIADSILERDYPL